jgi:hypothetical protein
MRPMNEIECPRCHLIFNLKVNPVQRLAAFYSGHVEPGPVIQPPAEDGFAPIAFASPATSPGGTAHLTIGDASTGKRPSRLAIVFVAANSVAEADRTPEFLLGHPDYPQDSVDIPDGLSEVSITVSGVTPGNWDVAAIATYPDA